MKFKSIKIIALLLSFHSVYGMDLKTEVRCELMSENGFDGVTIVINGNGSENSVPLLKFYFLRDGGSQGSYDECIIENMDEVEESGFLLGGTISYHCLNKEEGSAMRLDYNYLNPTGSFLQPFVEETQEFSSQKIKFSSCDYDESVY